MGGRFSADQNNIFSQIVHPTVFSDLIYYFHVEDNFGWEDGEVELEKLLKTKDMQYVKKAHMRALKNFKKALETNDRAKLDRLLEYKPNKYKKDEEPIYLSIVETMIKEKGDVSEYIEAMEERRKDPLWKKVAKFGSYFVRY